MKGKRKGRRKKQRAGLLQATPEIEVQKETCTGFFVVFRRKLTHETLSSRDWRKLTYRAHSFFIQPLIARFLEAPQLSLTRSNVHASFFPRCGLFSILVCFCFQQIQQKRKRWRGEEEKPSHFCFSWINCFCFMLTISPRPRAIP